MEALNSMFSLREWLYRLRRKYQRRPPKTYTYYEGLPPGLEQDLLDSICREHFDRRIQSVRYTHLSGWKSSGAYRLRIIPTAGPDIYLIFKLANYEHTEIPALRDFPLHPGLPEHIIYSQPAGPLADFLPRIYLVEELQPRVSYRYLLEDLYAGDYRIARSDEQRIEAARLLPDLHAALDAWSAQADTTGLLRYDREFSEGLQTYVFSRLERYSQHANSPALRSVLANWEQIASVHLRPEFFEHPQQFIHGDANFSNFHIASSGSVRGRFKIVDWEWAGFGSPYADLAAVVKSSYAGLEKDGYDHYIRRVYSDLPAAQRSAKSKEEWRHFLWSRLERAMIDAAFLSAQVLDAAHKTRINLPISVDQALLRIQSYAHQLADGS